MSVNQAAEQLLDIIRNRRLQGEEPGTTIAMLLFAAPQFSFSGESLSSTTFLSFVAFSWSAAEPEDGFGRAWTKCT